MASMKLTPRQKMINMMYLVLTAILALNVSSEVLDAFKAVNDGIGISNRSQQSKNSGMFAELKEQYAIDSVRAKMAYTKAEQARTLSKKLHDLLEQYKQQLITEAGGIDAETGKIKRDDDVIVATRLFVENKGTKGKALKHEIEETRKQLLGLLEGKERTIAEQSLALKIDEPVSGKAWEYARFNEVPVVAAVTLLTKYQNDLLNAEGQVVQSLYRSVDAGTRVVDRMEAKIISPSSYVLQGEAYKADIMIAASSSTLEPEVFLGTFTADVKRVGTNAFAPITSKSEALPLINPIKVDVENGLGKMNAAGGAAGNKKYTGVIRVKNSNDGSYTFYPFEGEYLVAPKTAVISPKMMNVMFIGLDNAVDVSVPGFAQSEVTAVMDGDGSLIKNADGTYMARVNKIGTVKVLAKAKVNGKEMVMGEQQFRVKRVPDPVTTLDGLHKGGKIKKAQIKTSKGIVALLENFYYPTRFTIESFEFRYDSRKNAGTTMTQNTGAGYNPKVQDIIDKQVTAGDKIFFDEIVAVGPGGKRKLSPIAFEIVP